MSKGEQKLEHPMNEDLKLVYLGGEKVANRFGDGYIVNRGMEGRNEDG